MLIIDMLSWWYTRGWLLRAKDITNKVGRWAQYFSFGIILRTLFAPWRQMVQTPGADQPLYVKKDAFIDNTVSRFVGFGVRITVLVAGFITIIFVAIFYSLFVLLWPFIPLTPFILAGAGFVL